MKGDLKALERCIKHERRAAKATRKLSKLISKRDARKGKVAKRRVVVLAEAANDFAVQHTSDATDEAGKGPASARRALRRIQRIEDGRALFLAMSVSHENLSSECDSLVVARQESCNLQTLLDRMQVSGRLSSFVLPLFRVLEPHNMQEDALFVPLMCDRVINVRIFTCDDGGKVYILCGSPNLPPTSPRVSNLSKEEYARLQKTAAKLLGYHLVFDCAEYIDSLAEKRSQR
jgi:hypothetical protein